MHSVEERRRQQQKNEKTRLNIKIAEDWIIIIISQIETLMNTKHMPLILIYVCIFPKNQIILEIQMWVNTLSLIALAAKFISNLQSLF